MHYLPVIVYGEAVLVLRFCVHRNSDGVICGIAGDSVLLYLAENIPKLKSRQNRPAEGATAAAPAVTGGKKNKGKR